MRNTPTIGDIVKAILIPPAFALFAYATFYHGKIAYQYESQLYNVRGQIVECIESNGNCSARLLKEEQRLSENMNIHKVGAVALGLYDFILLGYGAASYTRLFLKKKSRKEECKE